MNKTRPLFIFLCSLVIATTIAFYKLDSQLNELKSEVATNQEDINSVSNDVDELRQEVEESEDDAPPEPKHSIIFSGYKIKYTHKELQCLAKNIYYEAGNDGTMGMYAVAQVTLNRLKTRHWGRSICDVVYAKAQFSWTLHRVHKPYKKLWKKSVRIATEVLNGARVEGLEHSLYYHADYIETPEWVDPNKEVGKIGSHIFYTGAKYSWIKI